MRISDWSSDVCSSDLPIRLNGRVLLRRNTGFLECDFARYVDAFRVVGQYLAFNTVFERRNDGSTVGVVFGVGGKYKLDVERQPQFESTYLDIFLLKHVEKRYLYAGL